jgi:acyl-CoA thioesterase-1
LGTRIVALGASQVAGYGVGAAAAFPVQLEAPLKANGLDVTALNAGKSGDTSAQVLARPDAAGPAGTSIVLLGAFILNDHRMGISPATSGANMAMMRWIEPLHRTMVPIWSLNEQLLILI